MREACKFNVQIHNGNILMSSVTKDPGVSSNLPFSGSGINFPRPLYMYIRLYVVQVLISCVFLILLILLLVVLLVVYGHLPPEYLALLLHHLLFGSLTQGHHSAQKYVHCKILSSS
jgi:hypothetical protein